MNQEIIIVPGATVDIPYPFDVQLRTNAKMPKNEIWIWTGRGHGKLVVNIDTGEVSRQGRD